MALEFCEYLFIDNVNKVMVYVYGDFDFVDPLKEACTEVTVLFILHQPGTLQCCELCVFC